MWITRDTRDTIKNVLFVENSKLIIRFDIYLKYGGFSLMGEYANRITTNGSPVINDNQIYIEQKLLI